MLFAFFSLSLEAARDKNLFLVETNPIAELADRKGIDGEGI